MARNDQDSIIQDYRHYTERGWLKFDYDVDLEDWVNASLPAAREALYKKENQHWWRYQNTWFVGVNCLNNNRSGKVEDGLDLQGQAANFISQQLDANLNGLDRAQISVCYPGYPRASDPESAARARYRFKRDAAHIDGLLKEGTAQQRYIREPHDYILGIAMSEFSADASPFVVWQGSHQMVRQTFQAFFNEHDPQNYSDQPVTEIYTKLRKRIFSECERIEIALRPGEAILAHRLLLHGTAAWQAEASAGPDGRMICFFRPSSLTIQQWLDPAIY